MMHACMHASTFILNFKTSRVGVTENLVQTLHEVAPLEGVDHFAGSRDAARARRTLGARLASAQKTHRQVNLLPARA